MYRCADALLARAAAYPGGMDLPAWPDVTDSTDRHPEQWRDWLEQVWSRDSIAEAIEVASPVLARQVRKMHDEPCRDPREMRRVVLAVARYILRMTGRATPFGLFAGVAPADLGPRLAVRWGEDHHPVLRPGAEWLAAMVTSLEACPELLRRLTVVANNLSFVRDGRLVAPDQQHVGDWDDGAGLAVPVEVSVRHTRAVEAVMRYARSPVVAGDLAGKLAADFPQTPQPVIDGMLAELVRLRLLLTGLRPPMTVTDALGHVVGQLTAVQAAGIPQAADRARQLRAIRDDISRHNRARSPGDRQEHRGRLADQMRRSGGTAGQPFTVDLRVDAGIVLPEEVAREAAAAAAALTRLTPYPRGLPTWEDYHAAFMERYGTGAAITVLEVVNPDTGLGFPAGYRGSARKVPEPPLSGRDKQLLALAQKAAMGGSGEITLDDQIISDLAAGNVGLRQIPPHAEIFVQIHAASPAAVERGEFQLVVTGASRAAGTTTGRFLDLLDPGGRDRATRAYADLPTLRAGALVAQVSCPPVHAQSESVARAPAVLPRIISVAEHPEPGCIAMPLDDLAVSGDADGLWLVLLAEQRPVEPTVLNAVAFRHFSHPIVQFLCEISRSRAPVYMPFSWGAAASLPLLPRIRYGRSVLAPARWNLPAGDLPGKSAPWPEWKQGVEGWRQHFRLPAWVCLGEADNLLRLDLDQDLHLALLRSHLDRRGHAIIHEAPGPRACGWLDGRAHEIAVPLTSATPAVTPPSPPAAWVRATGRDHAHLPGCSEWLFVKLYGHPARQADLLAHVPDLIAAWDSPPRWWYVRYQDPEPHLRLRFPLPHADAYGPAARRAGTWAASLRNLGLVSRMQLDTYYPETGRYGTGPAMTAAEETFAADSATALTQLQMAAQAGTSLDAITVAGLVDLAVSFTGSTDQGMRWLIDQLPREPSQLDRALHDTATRLADPHGDWAALRATAGGETVLRAWHGRRAALAAYREQLALQRDPLSALPSLLHMHHVRMLGIDPDRERTGRRLARAAALRWTATTTRAGQ